MLQKQPINSYNLQLNITYQHQKNNYLSSLEKTPLTLTPQKKLPQFDILQNKEIQKPEDKFPGKDLFTNFPAAKIHSVIFKPYYLFSGRPVDSCDIWKTTRDPCL